jgi:D-3-phosphoglycerate dehydrogenase
MYSIQTLNKISFAGLDCFPRDLYKVDEERSEPDAILVRSYNMHDFELPRSLKSIARAGAGVNNIPVQRCSKKGIVVFNTPGANANSVKGLVIAGLFLSSRRVVEGIIWAKSLIGKGEEVPKLIEKGKAQFSGPEIRGKRLGVIGLGAVGVMVANDATALGMHVIGYDPFISVESAWGLSRDVRRANSLNSLLAHVDYITLHVPLNDETSMFINREKFALMKKGVRILNFARGGLINNRDLRVAIENGTVAVYLTDFPDEELLTMKNVIAIPHLGASTPEAEDNCAKMAVEQTREFLEKGTIRNSVNYPDCQMDFSGKNRLVIANDNVPAIVGQITTILAGEGINIADMLNRSKEGNAFNIIDLDSDISDESVRKIKLIEGVTMVRVI